MPKELISNVPVCMALGFFDSLHIGHRQIIGRANEYAKQHNISSAILTFINNPYKVFNRDSKLIYTFSERVQLLHGLIEYIVPVRFDKQFKNIQALDFLTHLTNTYNIKCFICGYDFLFGEGAKGDTELLREYCSNKGIELLVIDQIQYDNERVSSSLIKQLLTKGDIDKANKLLTNPFFAQGVVVTGRGVGRQLNIPTANIKLPREKLLIKNGVYGTYTGIDGKLYKSATNIGPRPTFDLTMTTVECFIKDFSGDLYGKRLTLYFHKYLRDNQRFGLVSQLTQQVHKDIEW